MPYKDSEKQKEYLKKWREQHKDYFNNYYKENEYWKNKQKLKSLKQLDKKQLEETKKQIISKKRIRENPMMYKDYWTEDEFYNDY